MNKIDALIAEHVMRFEFSSLADIPEKDKEMTFCRSGGTEFYRRPGESGWTCLSCYGLPPYSTDMNAAMEVVKKMIERGFDIQILFIRDCVEVQMCGPGEATSEDLPYDLGDNAAEVICRSALKAVGVEVPE